MDRDRGAGSDGGAIRIRRALPADARAIAEVAVRGWQTAYRGLMPDEFLAGLSVAGRAAAWREMLDRDADGGIPAWLAERDGRAVGFVSSGPPRDEDVPLPGAEVYAIYVLPEEWRAVSAARSWTRPSRTGGNAAPRNSCCGYWRETRRPAPSTRQWAGGLTAPGSS